MKWRARVKRGALLLVTLLAVAVFGWVPYWMAGLGTTRRFQFPDRDNVGLTPASFSLPSQDVAFRSSDGVELRGWWVPAPSPRGTVVLVHGLNRSRIEMIRRVPFLHRLGWSALLFDLRHHGASGGTATTFGQLEKDDVLAAVAFARSRQAGPVVLWGVSLGGASVVLAAAADPTVTGVICDSSYRSLRDTVQHHVRLARRFRWWLRLVPAWPLGDEVVFWMGRRGGFDPDAIDVGSAAARLAGRPALFVANSEDRRMPKEIAIGLRDAAGPSAEVLIIPGKSHGGAYRDGTAPYEAAVARVLQAAAGRPALTSEGGRS